MKIFLVLAVAVVLIIAAILYFGSGDLDLTPPKKPSQADAPPQDFHAVTALLQKDMGSVPTSLDAPEVEPVNAFHIKSRLSGATAAHQEYQVLAKACDLIIYADQEHSVRQRQDVEAQRGASGDLMASAGARQAATANTRTAIHAKAQADWDGYRQQTDAEVKRLLGSLQNAKL